MNLRNIYNEREINLTANEVYKRLIHFIENEFAHSVARQDKDIGNLRKTQIWLFVTIVGGLLSIVGGLLYLIVR